MHFCLKHHSLETQGLGVWGPNTWKFNKKHNKIYKKDFVSRAPILEACTLEPKGSENE